MLKTIRSISGAKRASTLALVAAASLVATGAAVADGGSGGAGSAIAAAGGTFIYDSNQDGVADYRRFRFHAIEHADGSVTGQAHLQIVVDDLDQDGTPDVEPFTLRVRMQVGGATRFSDTEAMISAVVVSHNYPLDCASGGYSVGMQVAFAVQDNGVGTPADQITPLLTWDCVPFLGSDYGVDDSVSFAEWAVDQGFGPFLAQFLLNIDFGDIYLR